LDIIAAGNEMLTLSEVQAPGWHASVDGNRAPVLQANYIPRDVMVQGFSRRRTWIRADLAH
jgi:hypothetical protein